MIYATYPAKRVRKHGQIAHVMPPKPPAKTFPPPALHSEARPNKADADRASIFGITPEEFVRRDNIVRQVWLDCQFKPGEVVRPKSNEMYEKYGRVAIKGVYKSYHDFSISASKDWPENDKPLIIAGTPDKGDAMLLCSAESLSRFYSTDGGVC